MIGSLLSTPLVILMCAMIIPKVMKKDELRAKVVPIFLLEAPPPDPIWNNP